MRDKEDPPSSPEETHSDEHFEHFPSPGSKNSETDNKRSSRKFASKIVTPSQSRVQNGKSNERRHCCCRVSLSIHSIRRL